MPSVLECGNDIIWLLKSHQKKGGDALRKIKFNLHRILDSSKIIFKEMKLFE